MVLGIDCTSKRLLPLVTWQPARKKRSAHHSLALTSGEIQPHVTDQCRIMAGKLSQVLVEATGGDGRLIPFQISGRLQVKTVNTLPDSCIWQPRDLIAE